LETKVFLSKSKDPYVNLSVEKYLTERVQKGQAYLFLWQNEHTVVIGRNQNPYAECDMKKIREDNVDIARRLSGGGAVFHGLGNLNFSFINHESEQQIETNRSVILKTLERFDLHAEFMGRNDICMNGKKFSGNAFFSVRDGACHHGTLLVCENHEKMKNYLTVSDLKLKSKGIASVKSRVINLSELNPKITIASLIEKLARIFLEIEDYQPVNEKKMGHKIVLISEEEAMNIPKIKADREIFSSYEWIYKESPSYSIELKHRFSWGEMSVQLSLNNNIISDCRIYTDCMEANLFIALEEQLKQIPLRKEAVFEIIRKKVPEIYQGDLYFLFQKQLF
jgi:lipoate-protein ligase A